MDNFLFVPRALAAALFDTAFAFTIGALLANLLLSGDTAVGRPSVRHSITLMIVALAAQAWLAVAVMSGSYAPGVVRSELVDVLTGTHAGLVILSSLACAVIALLCSLLVRRAELRAPVVLVMMALLTCTRAASGHAAAEGNFALPEIVQFVHLASIAVWGGGVIVSGLLVVPRLHWGGEPAQMSTYTGRLSQAATIALLVVIVSGAYNSYRGIGLSLAPLRQGLWGALLITKVAIVCIAMAIGAYSRNIVRRPATISREESGRLVLALRVEAVTMLLILTISAFLANSTPPLPS
jgi:putative copper resistance protein D